MSGAWVRYPDRVAWRSTGPDSVVFSASLRTAGDLGRQAPAARLAGYLEASALPPTGVHHCRQVHGRELHSVSPGTPLCAGEGDGVFDPEGRTLLGVFTADCLAVALISPAGPLALIHSGWRGTRAGIVVEALHRLRAAGAAPETLTAVFGPAAHVCCYRVGDEFRDYFPEERLHRSASGLYFDNPGTVVAQLVQAGVPEARIVPNPYCTICHNDLFYSYRAEGSASGRILNLLYRVQEREFAVNRTLRL